MPGFLILCPPDPCVSRCLFQMSVFPLALKWRVSVTFVFPSPLLYCGPWGKPGPKWAGQPVHMLVKIKKERLREVGYSHCSPADPPLSVLRSFSKALGSLKTVSVLTGLGWPCKKKMGLCCWWSWSWRSKPGWTQLNAKRLVCTPELLSMVNHEGELLSERCWGEMGLLLRDPRVHPPENFCG